MSVGSTPRGHIVEVVGYHGTSAANVATILDRASSDPLRPGLGFESKDWFGHWLGQGIYLWQDAPRRAQEWARARFGTDAAVLGVLLYLPLDECIDLLDVTWVSLLRQRHAALGRVGVLRHQRVAIRRPTAHRLDCQVLDSLVEDLRVIGRNIVAVRAPFIEGRRIYPQSAFYERGHVQIAIRDRLIIRDMWRE